MYWEKTYNKINRNKKIRPICEAYFLYKDL